MTSMAAMSSSPAQQCKELIETYSTEVQVALEREPLKSCLSSDARHQLRLALSRVRIKVCDLAEVADLQQLLQSLQSTVHEQLKAAFIKEEDDDLLPYPGDDDDAILEQCAREMLESVDREPFVSHISGDARKKLVESANTTLALLQQAQNKTGATASCKVFWDSVRRALKESLKNFPFRSCAAGAAAGMAAGGFAAMMVTPILNLAGFGAGGIAAGSPAAAMMSAAATANGGGVASGSVVAVCQSVGVVGLGAGPVAAMAVGGAAIGAVGVTAYKYYCRNKSS